MLQRLSLLTDVFTRISFLKDLEFELAGEMTTFQRHGVPVDQK